MQTQPWLALMLAHEIQHRQLEDAAQQRLHRSLSNAPSLRRTVGRRIVLIGARIAAEPSLELARSR